MLMMTTMMMMISIASVITFIAISTITTVIICYYGEPVADVGIFLAFRLLGVGIQGFRV